MRSKLSSLVKALGGLLAGLLIAATSPSSVAQIPHTETHRALLEARTQQRAEALGKQAEKVTKESLKRQAEDRQKTLTRLANEGSQAEKNAQSAQRDARNNRPVAVEQKLRKKKKLKPGKKQNQTSGRGYTPVRGAVIANFGAVGSWARYHTGMDFTAAYGAPVRAAMPGRVTFAGNAGDWAGNFVVIRHDDGQKTLYAHLSSIGTHPGVYVSGGTIIGRVGTTGRSFGPHLHLELYPQSARAGDVYRAIDPGPWLRANGVKI